MLHVLNKLLASIKSLFIIICNLLALHIPLHYFSLCTLVSVLGPRLSSMFNSDCESCFHFSCYECCSLYWIHTGCSIVRSHYFNCLKYVEVIHFVYHSLIVFDNGKKQNSPFQLVFKQNFGFAALQILFSLRRD
jgi:hypothetical protein